MAAHPKNKITRVEQGKRRAGNTPKLRKDTTVSHVPLYKRDFFDKIMKKIGVTAKTTARKETAKTASKKNKTTHTAMNQSAAVAQSPKAMAAPLKKIRNTQHKGG